MGTLEWFHSSSRLGRPPAERKTDLLGAPERCSRKFSARITLRHVVAELTRVGGIDYHSTEIPTHFSRSIGVHDGVLHRRIGIVQSLRQYTMGESRSPAMYDIFVSSLNKRPIVPSLSLYATPYMDV